MDKAKEYGVTRAALSEGAADDHMFDLNRVVLADGGIAIKASNTDTLLQLDAAAGGRIRCSSFCEGGADVCGYPHSFVDS